MIKLVISDLDGTFLNSEGTFDRKLYQKVRALMAQQGIIFAPCTGKQCERVEELFGPELASDLWILGDSATRIKHQGQYVYESFLPNSFGQQIITQLEKIADDHVIIACTPDTAVIKNSVPEEIASKLRRSYTRVTAVEELATISEDFVKITVFDPQLRCFTSVKELADFQEQAYIVASEAAWIDISNYGVHKGTTVAQLQKILKVTPAETMAFGDGLNDLELLAAADFSFAMRNAFPEVQEIARYITGSNDEQAVLTTMDQIIRLQK